MCLFDLTHGRRRFPRVQPVTVATPITLAPDARRVAVLLSAPASGTMTVTSGISSPTSQIASLTNSGTSVFLMRVEDLGEIVMGQLVITTSANTGGVTEMLTNEEFRGEVQK